MESLHTIENIHKIFDTGSRPVLVSCNDRKMWICKYDVAPHSLLNELLAAEFAKIWNIKVPETSLITVKPEHIPDVMKPRIQSHWFKKECFGSLYLPDAKEIDLTTFSLFKNKNFRDKVHDKDDFLKIALFDIWLSNEDRNYNNFNLLLETSVDKISFFYAIDHVDIFNTSSLKYGIYQINDNDTILNTELAKILFSKNTKLMQNVDKLMHNFYLCTLECKNKLSEIMKIVPKSWTLDLLYIQKQLENTIFKDSWFKECEDTFRKFIQSFIRN